MVGLVRERAWVMIPHFLTVTFDKTLSTVRATHKRPPMPSAVQRGRDVIDHLYGDQTRFSISTK